MANGAGLPIETTVADDAAIDTLLVVGGAIDAMRLPEEVATVQRLAGRTTRIASICTGAFLLAGAGLLGGKRATTHWSRAQERQAVFPAVTVEGDRIHVVDGPLWTSAGVTAGIDLALALIEADHRVELARQVSRELVVYHRRPGGQSQFSALSQMEPESDRMRVALAFAREHLSEPLPVERLAEAARLSPRQFGRAFLRETGKTPAKAIERLRTEAAYLRLQDGSEPVETIARAVGFNDPERMRWACVVRYRQPPQAMRRIMRST
jgi:transcriptional regulator GlxA family with amidase domain